MKKKQIPTKKAQRVKKRKVGTKTCFSIVGIGASAGGLEAFRQLLEELPGDTGMAFVLIQHLDPKHKSLAPEILSRISSMPLCEIKDGMVVLPNHIYLTPPNFKLAISKGVLDLLPRTKTATGAQTIIDDFFQSLAQDQKERSIGVILSGTASDGTQGLKAIKFQGGLSIVQDPKSAQYSGMPQSAIKSGIVDLILAPDEIAHELARIAQRPYFSSKKDSIASPFDNSLRTIFSLLLTKTKVDFTNYKYATIKRRIERRMIVRKADDLNAYTNYLQKHPEEIDALYADILINVTEFFRDPKSFQALKEHVFPNLLKRKETNSPIRIWVPGCSTGMEVYSLAILLVEYLGDDATHTPIQIFATDISEQVLQVARAGVYSPEIERAVNKQRLTKFFTKIEGGYKLNKDIRDLCLFSRHDVTRDPPFSKVDLISCRNLLIYFAPVLQKRIFSLFHFALNPEGFLWLGKSEGPDSLFKLFKCLNKTHKIYRKINIASPFVFHFPFNDSGVSPPSMALKVPGRTKDSNHLWQDADHIALDKYAPPFVIVNENMDIVQFRGRTAPYLEPASGLPSSNLFKMARQELLHALHLTTHEAQKKNTQARHEGLSFEIDGQFRTVNLEVVPVNLKASPEQRNFMIFFEEVVSRPVTAMKKESPKSLKDKRFDQLLQDFAAAQSYQQSMAEEFETTQEELTSTNEELQSTNEELQSSNEELETAKEELQSTNEELTTINDELQKRNSDLVTISNDLNNLLSSVEIPLLIIDRDHRIRKFTPQAQKVFELIASDVGRPLSYIGLHFDVDLDALVSEVIESLIPQEKDTKDRQGAWTRLQIRPYKTNDNRIDGAIIALINIQALKQSLEISESALTYATTVADAVELPFVVLNSDFNVQSANLSFYHYFQIAPQTTGINLFNILSTNQDKSPKLRDKLKKILHGSTSFKKYEMDYASNTLGPRKLLLSGSAVHWEDKESQSILLALEDITERKKIELKLAKALIKEKEARDEAEKSNLSKDIFLATLSHDLRTPLTAILLWSQMLKLKKLNAGKSKMAIDMIVESSQILGQLIDDLLDISRIILGKLSLNLETIELPDLVKKTIESIRMTAESKSIQVTLHSAPSLGLICADPIRLHQIIWNLLSNAIKFSPEKSSIEVHLKKVSSPSGEQAQIQVIDHGEGISPDFLPHIFDRFTQADSSDTRSNSGLGLGLAIVNNLVQLHGGTTRAESPGLGKGATFTIHLPIFMCTIKSLPLNESEGT